MNACWDACLVSRFYLERELKRQREQRTTSRQVVIPQKEPRAPESTPKVSSKERKLLLWSRFSVTQCISPTVYSRRPVGQKGEQPVNHRSRGQIQSQLQPVSSFEKFLLKSNLTVLFFPICHLYFLSPPHLRSLSHHEDEEVSWKVNFNRIISRFRSRGKSAKEKASQLLPSLFLSLLIKSDCS